MKRIILASKSPRRRELLSALTDKFEVITREVDETLPDGIDIRSGTELLAVRKGRVVADEYPSAIVISSDTLVELDGIALGKPKDEDDARRMLKSLSGRAHNVHTGVAVHCNGRVYSGVATSSVIFKELTDDKIDGYIATGEPMDKAGSYGIQGRAGAFVDRYIGDFDTIVGLSMRLLGELIDKAGGLDD
jgi:septum formation protein